MGWDYEHRIAYGVTVDAWSNSKFEPILEKYQDLLGYDGKMAFGGKGYLFIYVKSTYKVLGGDEGSWTRRPPDVTGTAFSPPRHPELHRQRTDLDSPALSEDEKIALDAIMINSDLRCMWVEHASVE